MAPASLNLKDSAVGLPRIAIITDVAVERTGAGSLLLYRLLKDYPADALRIFFNPSQGGTTIDTRLLGVPYYPVKYRFPRALQNRLNPFWPIAGAYQMRLYADEVFRCLGDFRPQAILSVANGFLCFTADLVARRLNIPLHLFLHEDWSQIVTLHRHGWLKALVAFMARATIKPILLRPGARFSVSPGMADELLERYRLKTEVIYPNRGDDSPSAIVRVAQSGSRPPTIAHAGFIHVAGNAALLRALATILGALGGHLDLYTTHSEADLARFGLVAPVVRRVGFFPAKEFAERVASSAHALFLTASFEEKDRAHESTLFPSKLADYTAIGLPIFVWGPVYSSAARWSLQNPGATLLFTNEEVQPIRDAIMEVSQSVDYARTLAAAAVSAGNKFFELSIAREQFYRALLGTRTEVRV